MRVSLRRPAIPKQTDWKQPASHQHRGETRLGCEASSGGVGLGDVICDSSGEDEPDYGSHPESDIRETAQALREAVILDENCADGGEHQVQIPVRHCREEGHEEDNGRQEKELDRAR